MVTTDVELELRLQLKEAGKQLSHPPASVDELLHILDQTEKLISKVDQSPNNIMLEALRPSMKALVDERFLNHSNVDVKVAVAACLCEITRITAPDAPYNDEEMKDVFQLIVSSFENLSDKSSRSYGKRVSILDTVSKVRSSCIMLDLECKELIVEMFEHFIKSVRDHHEDSIFSSMMNIMALVLEESEDISVDMLKPLLACIKNNTDGALPIARKLGEGVLKRSAAKVKPYVTKALRILGDSLDNYSQVLASICEGTTDVEHNDETTSAQRQADESKLTTASSDNTAQVLIGNAETDATLDTTFKSVRNNERVSGNGGSADEESSKKPEEAIDHVDPNPTSKFDTEDTLSEKLAKAESKPEHTSKRRGNKTDTTLKSATPDSPRDYGVNKIDKHTDFPISVPKAIESEVADAPSESGGVPDDNYVKKDNLPKEPEAANAGAQSRSRSIPSKSRTKRAGRSKKKISSQDNAPSTAVVLAEATEGMSDTDMKSPKRAGRSKKKSLSQDDAPSTDVLTKAPERMSGSDMKSPKRARKKAPFAQEDKLPAAIATVEDSKPTSDSDSKHLKTSSKKVDTVDSGTKLPKRFGKKVGGVGSAAKKPKLSGKKTDAGNSEANKSKQADTKDNESDSDATLLSQFTGNKGRSRQTAKPSECTANKEEGSDSDTQSLKLSAKKDDRSSSALVKSSSKKDGKKHKNSKNVEEKDQTKSLPEDDGMDISPMSAVKTATQEGNLEEALVTSLKRKRASSKDKVSTAIKIDDSLVGQKVKVWWPDDKTYYEGVIELFDSAKNMHTVFYVDGEREILNLRSEKWEVLQDYSAHNEDKTAEGQSTGVFPETSRPNKKQKINSGSGALLEKSKDAPKRAGGASLSGKSKGLTSKSSASSKGKGKVGMKSTSQKNSGKAVKSANSKEAGMSMEDDEEISKIIPKKQETPKIVYKSKGRTPKSSNKANTDEPVKSKSISVNVKEPVDADAAEAPASPKGKPAKKTTKTGSKSGRKRKKST